MTTANKIEVCFTPNNFHLFDKDDSIVVVIDIFRATSAICTALSHGVEKIIPVSSIYEARSWQAKGFLVAAERDGAVVDGFTLGNSPFSYMTDQVKGKEIVITTTNGTLAFEVARSSYKVVAGSFLNIDILYHWLLKEDRNIILLCSGWKNKFNLEDTLFAGALVNKLLLSAKFITECDSAMASNYLYEQAKKDLYVFLASSSHRRRLEKLSLEMDIRYCLTSNLAPVIPILEGNGLVKLQAAERLINYKK